MREDEEYRVLDIAPEYFPGVDLCAAMCRSNSIILDCTRQYVRQSFQNRTRIRTPDGWQWLSVPLAAHQHGNRIMDVHWSDEKDWRRLHLRSLRFNYRSTPFFDYIEPRIEVVLYEGNQTFADLLVNSTQLIIELLGLSCSVTLRDKDVQPNADSDQRLVSIERLCTPDMEVERVRIGGLRYRQNFDGFVEGLSGLDLIFNYGPEAFSVLDNHILD